MKRNMTKHLLIGIAILLSTATTHAQGWGIYAGVQAHYGELNNDDYGFAGGTVAFIADSRFAIGVGGYAFGALDKIGLEDDITGLPKLAGGYGGLHLEPMLFGNGRTSISFPVLLGWGKAGLQTGQLIDGNFDYDAETRDWQKMYVAEPGVKLNFHLSRFFQLDIGAKYRFSSKLEIPGITDQKINGWSGGVELKFGLFPKRYQRYNGHNNNSGRRNHWD